MDRLEDWRRPREIRAPGDLEGLLVELGAALDAGVLRQVPSTTASPLAYAGDLRRIPVHGPWPDLIEVVLEDARGEVRYALIAETYHGSGGSWGPSLR